MAVGTNTDAKKKQVRDLGELGTAIRDALTLPWPVRWLRGLIALGLWGFVLTDLLLFDVSSRVISEFPYLEPLFRFRGLALLLAVAVVLLVFRNRYLFLFAGYIAFFPIVVLLWLLPKAVVRNWAVVIAFWPAIHESFSKFRVTFFLWVLAVVSCFLVLLAENRTITVAAMLILGAYLLMHYFRRGRAAFSSRTGFAALTPMVRGVWRTTLEKEQSPIEATPGTEEHKQKLGQRLVNMYMTTTMLYVIGEKLRVVIRTRKLDLYLAASLAYSFVLTIAIFAFEYFGLYRVSPEHFDGVSEGGFPEFLGYSLSTALNAGLSALSPLSLSAQMLSYAELIAMLSLAILFVFMLFTSVRERHRQDLDEVVQELGNASVEMGTFLQHNHDLTVAAADRYFLEINPLLARWLLRLRYGEDRAREIPGYVVEGGAEAAEALEKLPEESK